MSGAASAGTISTHVLDTALGVPAANVSVQLEREGVVLATGVTDADGRVRVWSPDPVVQPGPHVLRFATGAYFAAASRATFYDQVTIEFIVRAGERYHVPLLVSPFGYSTYRGS